MTLLPLPEKGQGRLHDIIRHARRSPEREQAWKIRFPSRLSFRLAFAICDATSWADAKMPVRRFNQEVTRAR